MPLSFANVFNAMNNNFGIQYDAEEILRTIPQGSSTTERDSLGSVPDAPTEKVDFSTSINDLGTTFTLGVDGSTPNTAFSGVEPLENTPEVLTEETALPAEEVPPVVRPLPIIRGEKSSNTRKRDNEGKHPILNQCPDTKKVYPANELPTASGCLCAKGCGNHFVFSERENIHKKFWALKSFLPPTSFLQKTSSPHTGVYEGIGAMDNDFLLVFLRYSQLTIFVETEIAQPESHCC